jgi:hypothetical protein
MDLLLPRDPHMCGLQNCPHTCNLLFCCTVVTHVTVRNCFVPHVPLYGPAASTRITTQSTVIKTDLLSQNGRTSCTEPFFVASVPNRPISYRTDQKYGTVWFRTTHVQRNHWGGFQIFLGKKTNLRLRGPIELWIFASKRSSCWSLSSMSH